MRATGNYRCPIAPQTTGEQIAVMKCKTHQIHLVVLALLMCLPGVYSSKVLADAPMVACDLENFTVEAETTAEAQAVCKLVSDALPQLQDCHMPVKLPVKIIVSDEMRGVGPRCLGYYHCESSEIYVRSAEGMAQSIDPEGAYSQIETDAFFEGIVVHEIATNTPDTAIVAIGDQHVTITRHRDDYLCDCDTYRTKQSLLESLYAEHLALEA